MFPVFVDLSLSVFSDYLREVLFQPSQSLLVPRIYCKCVCIIYPFFIQDFLKNIHFQIWMNSKEGIIKAPLYKSEKHTAKICSKNVQQNKHEWKKKKKKKRRSKL